jgi:hypothetical protein
MKKALIFAGVLVRGIREPLGPNPFLVTVKSVEEDCVMCDVEEQP